jgi:glycosyltransferase involved in cell wall biosynthesis
MPPLPTVTIAIPTYNRVTYLRQALESALSQTYSRFQVVVSDNCSEDGTAQYLASVWDNRLLLLRQRENLGMAGNWNACLEQATGEFFLLLSDDDYLEKRAIERLVQALVESVHIEKVGLVYCRTFEVGPDNAEHRIDPIPPPSEDARAFALQYFSGNRKMHPSSTLFRTADLKDIGGYSQGSVVLAVDAIVWSRILQRRGLIVGVPEPLAYYRIHPTSITGSLRSQQWQSDIRALIGLWSHFFLDCPTEVRRQFLTAARHYESWNMAAMINQSAHSWRGLFRAISAYWACRQSFAGIIGMRNLMGGMAKLLAPEALKQPARAFLLRLQRP